VISVRLGAASNRVFILLACMLIGRDFSIYPAR
jgi:hypothetical protein